MGGKYPYHLLRNIVVRGQRRKNNASSLGSVEVSNLEHDLWLNLTIAVGWAAIVLFVIYRYRTGNLSKASAILHLSAAVGWFGFGSSYVLDWVGVPFVVDVGIPVITTLIAVGGLGYGLYIYQQTESAN